MYIGLPIFIYYGRVVRWNPWTIRMVFFACLLMTQGGFFSYAKVPMGDWVKDYFHLARNHYDRFGHFFQGVLPALICRDALKQKSDLHKSKLFIWVILSFSFSVAGLYELAEALASVIMGEDAASFLGYQNDALDSMKDMAMCLMGASLVCFSIPLLNKYYGKKNQKVEDPYFRIP